MNVTVFGLARGAAARIFFDSFALRYAVGQRSRKSALPHHLRRLGDVPVRSVVHHLRDMIKLPRNIWLVVLACAVALTGACATASGTRPRVENSNRMDTTEFRRPEFRTVYDAVRALHPDWLLARGGATSMGNSSRQTPRVGVFFEGESRGYSLDKLTDLVGSEVSAIRRISGSESLGTYGADWPWGGIVITRAR